LVYIGFLNFHLIPHHRVTVAIILRQAISRQYLFHRQLICTEILLKQPLQTVHDVVPNIGNADDQRRRRQRAPDWITLGLVKQHIGEFMFKL